MPTDTDARTQFQEDWDAAADTFFISQQSRFRIVAEVPFVGRFIVHCYPQWPGDNLIVVEVPWERAYTIPAGTYVSLSYLREKFGRPDSHGAHGGEMYALANCIAILNKSTLTKI